MISQRELLWQPEWFGNKTIDDNLINKIKIYQSERNLEQTGYVDLITYKSIYNEKNQFNLKNNKLNLIKNSTIVFNKKSHNTYVNKFYNFLDNDSLYSSEGQYIYHLDKSERDINDIFVSPDYCLNFETYLKINKQANISSHFYIDFDGSIYQFIDIQNIANQNRSEQDKSIYIDLNNPIYDFYQNKFGINRSINTNTTQLEYLPEQINSLKLLINFLNKKLNVKNISFNKVGVS